MSARQRKIQTVSISDDCETPMHRDASPPTPTRSSRSLGRSRRTFLLIIALMVVILTFIFLSGGSTLKLPNMISAELPKCPTNGKTYGIMMDAGSTGSRTHIFQFDKAPSGNLKLIDEVFRTVKPGLSSFAADPAMGAASLKPLMDAAVEAVPQRLHHCTTIELKATAGLRLLGDVKSADILSAVSETLKKSPFKVGKNAVMVMDAADEGTNAWLTVNFLLKTHSNFSKSSAILDLGGASMQVVLRPTDIMVWNQIPNGYKFAFVLNHKKAEIYQHSYLGYGLKEAGNAMLALVDDLASFPCFPATYDEKRRGDGKTVSNRQGRQNYESCMNFAERIMKKDAECQHEPCSFNGIHNPSLSESANPVYIFSYFYDRLDPFLDLEKHSIVSLEEITRIGTMVCGADDNPPEDDPGLVGGTTDQLVVEEKKNLNVRGEDQVLMEGQSDPKIPKEERQRIEEERKAMMTYRNKNKGRMCMDLVYITAVLRFGLMFPEEQTFHVMKKINGVETAWCLGATLRALE